MTKKSFRAHQVPRPGYPMLRDLDAGALRKWGLAAVGGLLLGGSGCARSPGAPPPASLTTQAATGTATETRTGTGPDAGAQPVLPPPTGGVPPPTRVEREKASAALRVAMLDADKDKTKRPSTPTPRERARLGGRKPSPRVERRGNGK